MEWHKPEQENIYEELATIEITSDVGDEIAVKEKIYTYEEISELEGRREKTIYDKDWDGRSEGRCWRGRSKSRKFTMEGKIHSEETRSICWRRRMERQGEEPRQVQRGKGGKSEESRKRHCY